MAASTYAKKKAIIDAMGDLLEVGRVVLDYSICISCVEPLQDGAGEPADALVDRPGTIPRYSDVITGVDQREDFRSRQAFVDLVKKT